MSRAAILSGGTVAALTLGLQGRVNLAILVLAAAVAGAGVLRGRRRPEVVLSPTSATLDHIIPHSQGGSDDMENLVTACWSCNRDKGNRTIEQWAAGAVVDTIQRERAFIPAEVRLAVYERDGHRCGGSLGWPYCETEVT